MLPSPGTAAPAPAVVDLHDHDWTLRLVDFVDGMAVEELECGCGAVWFR
jgi:hypothetical protein